MYLKISQGKTCVEFNESTKLYTMKNLQIHKKKKMEKMVSSNVTRTDITTIYILMPKTQISRKISKGLLYKYLSSISLAIKT